MHDLIIENNVCKGAIVKKKEKKKFAFCRQSCRSHWQARADWLERACKSHNIEHQPGTVDVGVRVEVRNEIMEEVNDALYESKLIGYPEPFKTKVRTFCQNPGGYVAQENYDNGLAVVNGHSFKHRKSENTNLAILCSHNFREPFNQPIEYAKRLAN